MEQINWYPGHMKKTKELIMENLKMVDVVVEVIDARLPISSRNPILEEITKSKKKIIALNKSDLADENENSKWISYFQRKGYYALQMNCEAGVGTKNLLKILNNIMEERNAGKARKRPLRLMIVGIPNVGKSSLINRLTGKKGAMTGNKPGVTKGKQWLNLGNDMQLLDTPGILWPKFEDQEVGRKLAFVGSIRDEILDLPTLCLDLLKLLGENYPNLLLDRYKLEVIYDVPLENMEMIAKKRGHIMSGAEIDYNRVARMIFDEYRAGTIGRITLEKV